MEGLEARGALVRVIPAVAFEAFREPDGFERVLGRLPRYENVVLTSVNGVVFTLRLLTMSGLGPGDFPPALCVGDKTARAWEESGGKVAGVPERYTAESLLDLFGEDLTGRAYLILRPEVVKTELGTLLKQRGAEVDEIILYRTVAPEEGAETLREFLAEGGPEVVFFASPSAVEGTMEMTGRTTRGDGSSRPGSLEPRLLRIPAVCIGPTTAKAAEDAGFAEVYFPDEHTAEGMVEELMVIAGGIKNRM